MILILYYQVGCELPLHRAKRMKGTYEAGLGVEKSFEVGILMPLGKSNMGMEGQKVHTSNGVSQGR